MWKGKNTYCLVGRKKPDNKKIRRVALVYKIAMKRSVCTNCTSRKLSFLKPIKPITNKTIKAKKSFQKL